MKWYRVQLNPEKWRWPTAQVAGRESAREPVVLQEVELTDEIRNSPLLIVEEFGMDEDPISEGVDATDGARALAEAEGVPLGAVVGSGAGGRVTKKDVERAMGVADD